MIIITHTTRLFHEWGTVIGGVLLPFVLFSIPSMLLYIWFISKIYYLTINIFDSFILMSLMYFFITCKTGGKLHFGSYIYEEYTHVYNRLTFIFIYFFVYVTAHAANNRMKHTSTTVRGMPSTPYQMERGHFRDHRDGNGRSTWPDTKTTIYSHYYIETYMNRNIQWQSSTPNSGWSWI